MTVTLKTGDTAPALTARIAYSDGSVPDLTGASATFALDLDGDAFLSGPATLDVLAGTATYDWQDGDLDTDGLFRGEFILTLADGTVVRAPEIAYIWITVLPSIGSRPVPVLPLVLDGTWLLDGTQILDGIKR
jgi:hypothetical protein